MGAPGATQIVTGPPLNEVNSMVVVLIAWIALALALGALIGRAIRRADDAQFPDRV